jgi:nucleoside-diphosphate-sugar epimerase
VNIGSGTAVEIRAVVSRIADALGLRHRVALGAIPPRQPEPPLLVASTKRLSGDVGWQPRFSLDDGLSRTIVWWREQER